MNPIRSITERVSRLLTAPGQELGQWGRFVRLEIRMGAFCVSRLRRHNVMAMSAALSFRTIFAMVPLLVLVFLMAKSMGIVSNRSAVLQEVFHETGLDQIQVETGPVFDELVEMSPESMPQSQPTSLPASQPADGGSFTVADTITDLLSNVEEKMTLGSLGPVGVALLIWTALTLLTTIERSLNRIFEAPRARPLIGRTIVYWAVITLGPLLLALVVYAFERVRAMVEGQPFIEPVMHVIGVITPAAVGVLLLAALYSLMPNTHVKLRRAVIAAVIAVPIWMLTKWGFGIYVQHVAKRNLYGALGIVPLFLLWMNLSWYIFLFGAQFCHTLAHVSRLSRPMDEDAAFAEPFFTLSALISVARRFSDEEAASTVLAVCDDLGRSPDATERLLDHLVGRGLLCRIEGEAGSEYLPGRPAERLRLCDLLETNDLDTTVAVELPAPTRELLAPVRQRICTGLGSMSLADAVADLDRKAD